MFGFWSLVAAGLLGAREMARWQEEGPREELGRALAEAGWSVEKLGFRVWLLARGGRKVLLYLEGAPAYGRRFFRFRRAAAARRAREWARRVGAERAAVVFLRRKEEGEEAEVALLSPPGVVPWLEKGDAAEGGGAE